MGRGSGSANHTQVTDVGLHEKDGVRVGLRLFTGKVGVAEIAALAERDIEQAKTVLAQQITGKTRGIRFTLVKASLNEKTMRATCDGCGKQVPLIGGDFSAWTKDGNEDYCGECASSRPS